MDGKIKRLLGSLASQRRCQQIQLGLNKVWKPRAELLASEDMDTSQGPPPTPQVQCGHSPGACIRKAPPWTPWGHPCPLPLPYVPGLSHLEHRPPGEVLGPGDMCWRHGRARGEGSGSLLRGDSKPEAQRTGRPLSHSGGWFPHGEAEQEMQGHELGEETGG